MSPQTSIPDRLAASFGALLRQEREDASSTEALVRGRERLMHQPATRTRPARFGILLAAAAFVAGFAVAAFALRPRAVQPISWEVRGSGFESHHWVGSAEKPTELAFSDGSRAVVRIGARVRVLRTDERGGEVLVERGTAAFEVTPRPQAKWRVLAGPFAIQVTGTSFETTWDPEKDALDVAVTRGGVRVESEHLGAPVALHGGQRLRASASAKGYDVREAHAPLPSSSSSDALSSAAISPSSASAEHALEPAPSTSSREAVADALGPAWPALLKKGRYEQVVASAEQQGLARSLEQRGLMDLRALSDAARYAGRTDIAERTLLAIRRRFPQASSKEAFLLGRLDEGRGKLPSALTWYERYLAEAPHGPLVAEVLGSRLRIVTTTRGRDVARPLAEEYLQRFPNGVHASAARRVLDQ